MSRSGFGLCCNPFDDAALKKLCRLKHRRFDKGYIILIDDSKKLNKLTPHHPESSHIWSTNQPTTILFPAHKHLNPLLRVKGKIAIRLVKDPTLLKICSSMGGFMVSTSANISRRIPSRDFSKVRKIFPSIPVLSRRGGARKNVSEIIDLESGMKLR